MSRRRSFSDMYRGRDRLTHYLHIPYEQCNAFELSAHPQVIAYTRPAAVTCLWCAGGRLRDG